MFPLISTFFSFSSQKLSLYLTISKTTRKAKGIIAQSKYTSEI